MADIPTAIAFVTALEDDHTHPGCITQLRGDSGGKTRVGISSRFHPALVEEGFFDGDPIAGSTNPLRWEPTTIPIGPKADAIIEDTYTTEYATPLLLDEIESQDVANHLLSFSVNEGQHEAVTCLQRCLPGLTVDGQIGPNTIAAINAAEPSELVAAYQQVEAAFYAHLAETQPNLAQYAKGMQDRASA